MAFKEEKLKQFEEQFTYGVLHSASSDLTGGKGTHFKLDDAKPAMAWLSQTLDEQKARFIEPLEDALFPNHYPNATDAERLDMVRAIVAELTNL
jgi:hypothetical protein